MWETTRPDSKLGRPTSQGVTSVVPKKRRAALRVAGPGLDFETRDSRVARRLLQTSLEPCQGMTSVVPKNSRRAAPSMGSVAGACQSWHAGDRTHAFRPQIPQKSPKTPNVENLSRGPPKIQSNDPS
jgi:hypothetical protein